MRASFRPKLLPLRRLPLLNDSHMASASNPSLAVEVIEG